MSGLSGNGSAITSGNPNSPQGSQVAFIQNTGTISQVVNFATAGSYQISVSAAQRGNYQGGSDEEIEVEVDGTLMTGTFTPGSTSYATYTSVPFNVTAGSHTITFVGVDPSGTDYTALLDKASINNVSPPGFSDPSFENPSQGSGESAYQYDPTGSWWSFSGSAGLAGNDSAFTSHNSVAPQGSQVAFIQKTGTIRQTVHINATGSYQISVTAAQRNNAAGSHEEVEVEVDGTVVGTFTPSMRHVRHLRARADQLGSRRLHDHLCGGRSDRGRLHGIARSGQYPPGWIGSGVDRLYVAEPFRLLRHERHEDDTAPASHSGREQCPIFGQVALDRVDDVSKKC